MVEPPNSDPGDIMHCGYLERARMGTMYNKRWFELYDEPSLYYYEDETKTKVRGMVRLREATLLISGDKLQLVATDIAGKASTLKLKAISADDAHLWGVKIKEAIENAPPEMDPETAKFMAEHGGDMAPKFTNQVVSSGTTDITGKRASGRRGSAALAAKALEAAKEMVRGSCISENDDDEVIQSISDDEEAGGAMPGGLAEQIKKGKKLNKVDHSADDSANWEVLVQGSLLREIMGGAKTLKKVEPVEEKGKSEAMARGGLLNEIQKGNHALKKVESGGNDDLMRTNTMTMARAGLMNEIHKIKVKEQQKKAEEAAPDAKAKNALLGEIAGGNHALKKVSEEEKKESHGEDMGRAGLLNEIKKGINPNKVRELDDSEKGSSDARVHMMVRGQLLNQIIGAKNQQLKRTVTRQNTASEEMMARGGLLNQIQKRGQEAEEKKVMAEAKEEHKSASNNLHAELLQGANLKPVGVTEGENDGGVKSEVILQAGLMNEIAKGTQLKSVDSAELDRTATMARGGLMHEIAKGKELKQVPVTKQAKDTRTAQLTMARAGLLNEINKKRVDDEAEEEKVARALHEANQGNLISAIHEGLTLRNVTEAADGGVNVELVLRGGLMFEINNLDTTKLKHVEEGDVGTANPSSEVLAQAGLLNEIKKGKELKQVPVTQLPKEKTDLLARGGLMNEIAKQKEKKEAEAAAAAPPPDLSGLHSQIAAGGVSLKKVEAASDGGVSEEMKLRGGMLNQIQKGVELREVDGAAPDGGPTQEVLARGGLMNEIAKGKDLKFVHDGQKAHREGPTAEEPAK